MKAKKIYENQEFVEDMDSYTAVGVGKDSHAAKFRVYTKLESMGVEFWLQYAGFTQAERKEYMIKNIYKIEEMVNILMTAGIDEESIKITTFDRCTCDQYQVIISNRVVAECFTYDDALKVATVMKAFSIESYSADNEIDVTQASFYVTENNLKIIDELPANRNKYKNV